jgi:PPOX class probable F420-dependent enzyme
MPPLTPSERDEFLAQPGILCRIATVTPAGAPHVTPAWFIREGDDVLITPRAHSSWLENIRNDPRVALTIDEEAHPYRKVTLEGAARIIHDLGEDDAWRDLYRRVATRYVTPAAAEAYVQATIDQPRALLAVSLIDSRVRTWRMPVSGEQYSGIWHQRYYEPGSKLSAH